MEMIQNTLHTLSIRLPAIVVFMPSVSQPANLHFAYSTSQHIHSCQTSLKFLAKKHKTSVVSVHSVVMLIVFILPASTDGTCYAQQKNTLRLGHV